MRLPFISEYWTCAIWEREKQWLVSYTWGNMNNNIWLNLKSVVNVNVKVKNQTQTKITIEQFQFDRNLILCWKLKTGQQRIKSNLNEYEMASILQNKIIAGPITYQTSKTNAPIIDHLTVVIGIDFIIIVYDLWSKLSIFNRTRKFNQAQ